MSAPLGAILRQLHALTDAETLALHREVSRRATAIRQRDPEYQQRQRTGYTLWLLASRGPLTP